MKGYVSSRETRLPKIKLKTFKQSSELWKTKSVTNSQYLKIFWWSPAVIFQEYDFLIYIGKWNEPTFGRSDNSLNNTFQIANAWAADTHRRNVQGQSPSTCRPGSEFQHVPRSLFFQIPRYKWPLQNCHLASCGIGSKDIHNYMGMFVKLAFTFPALSNMK